MQICMYIFYEAAEYLLYIYTPLQLSSQIKFYTFLWRINQCYSIFRTHFIGRVDIYI